MKIYSYDVQSDSVDQMFTELRYVIATARANSNELIALNIDPQNEGKESLMIVKVLKALKREGKIDFFADKESFERNSREASYLVNKFSDITEFIKNENFYFVVKI